MSKTWAPEWDERWDGPRQQPSFRKPTESALGFLNPVEAEPQNEFAYVWARWRNPEYVAYRNRLSLLERADKPRAQHYQLAHYEKRYSKEYADHLRKWLTEMDALSVLSAEDEVWLAEVT
jgi:hypothetical protein